VDKLGKAVLPSPQSINLTRTPDFLKAATASLVPETVAQAVSIFTGDQATAETRLNELKALYPDLSLALFERRETGQYAVLLATFANDGQVEQAMQIARRIAIPQDELVVQMISDPTQLIRIGKVRSIQTTWALVTDCYKSGSITVETLQACSGYWVTHPH
jgi:hypothetical protein